MLPAFLLQTLQFEKFATKSSSQIPECKVCKDANLHSASL